MLKWFRDLVSRRRVERNDLAGRTGYLGSVVYTDRNLPGDHEIKCHSRLDWDLREHYQSNAYGGEQVRDILSRWTRR